jgi:hypothetical protein
MSPVQNSPVLISPSSQQKLEALPPPDHVGQGHDDYGLRFENALDPFQQRAGGIQVFEDVAQDHTVEFAEGGKFEII